MRCLLVGLWRALRDNCRTYAFRRWREEGKTDSYIAFRRSRYLPFIRHYFFVKSLENTVVEEATPEGPKRHGWRGLLHALTAKWRVRKGVGEE